MFTIRPFLSTEWAAYREIRLQALRESPDAFGSTYEAEAAGSDERWSARLSVVFDSVRDRALCAEEAGTICGLLWCKVSVDDPTQANLYQMWVAPTMRSRGVARALLAEALAWAESVGVRCVRLGVTATESPAWRLYLSCGFRPVGPLEPLREGSRLMAQTMELRLGAA